MSYTSLSFVIFTAITILAYFIFPKKYRWVSLLVASFVFYAINSKLLTVFILISTFTLYGFGVLIDKQNELFNSQKKSLEKDQRKLLKVKINKNKKLLVTGAVAVNIGILLILKYSGFFAETINSIVSNNVLPIISFVLPLGISYYTLTGVSYIVDVYRGTVKAETNPLKLALFLSFFPQIVEGPMGRYGEMSETLFAGAKFDYNRFISGFIRILYGFIKKLVIADRAGFVVNSIFKQSDFNGVDVAFAVVMYTVQIYAEFSGCMDIVCGIAEILGIKLPENFNQPFFSKSIDEFWRRWHITLGGWLRDYVFYPISLSKFFKNISQKSRTRFGTYYGSLIPALFALFFVWFGNGFWHGASWKYVVYGLYYYVIMALGKLFQPVFQKMQTLCKINTASKPYNSFQIIRTDVIVCLGMLIFRSQNLTQTFTMLKSLFTNFSINVNSLGKLFSVKHFNQWDFVIVIVGIITMLIIGYLKENSFDIRAKIVNSNSIIKGSLLLVMIFTLIIFGVYGSGAGNATFIYGQF